MVDDVLRKEVEEIQADFLRLADRMSRLLNMVQAEQAAARIIDRETVRKLKELPPPVDVVGAGRGAPKPPKRTLHDRILEVFYREARLGETLTRHQVYYYSGCSPTSGGVNTAYADLFEDGLLAKVQGGAQLTHEGKEHCIALGFITEPFPVHGTFEAFVARQSTNLQKILRAQKKDGSGEFERRHLCALAGVSYTSGGTNTAIARLQHLGVAETGRGLVVFQPWYLKAIQPVVRAFDTKSGATTRHDVLTGKPR